MNIHGCQLQPKVAIYVVKQLKNDSFRQGLQLYNNWHIKKHILTEVTNIIISSNASTIFSKLKLKKQIFAPIIFETICIEATQRRPMEQKLEIRVRKTIFIQFFHHLSLLLWDKSKFSNFCYPMSFGKIPKYIPSRSMGDTYLQTSANLNNLSGNFITNSFTNSNRLHMMV